MLEDMEVGISDLQRVRFKITEAKTDDLSDLQPSVCGQRWVIVLVLFVHCLLHWCLLSQWSEGPTIKDVWFDPRFFFSLQQSVYLTKSKTDGSTAPTLKPGVIFFLFCYQTKDSHEMLTNLGVSSIPGCFSEAIRNLYLFKTERKFTGKDDGERQAEMHTFSQIQWTLLSSL